MQITRRPRANVGNYSSQVQSAVTLAAFCSAHDYKELRLESLVQQADKTARKFVKAKESMPYSHVLIFGRSNGISDPNRVHLEQTRNARVRAEGLFLPRSRS